MSRHHLTKIDYHVLFWGGIAVFSSFFFDERSVWLGAVLGAVLAFVNWISFRYLALRMAANGNMMRFGLFLAAKTLLLFGAVAVVILLLPVNPLAFILSLSSIVFGILTHAFKQSLAKGEAAMEKDF